MSQKHIPQFVPPPTAHLSCRVNFKIKKLTSLAAKDQDRTVSNLVNVILKEWLIKERYMKEGVE